MNIPNDPKLNMLLQTLHTESAGQQEEIDAYFRRRIAEGSLSWNGLDAQSTEFFRDKIVALEDEKASYCYLLCRALGARRIVECGTSHGVSTLYLAAAVRDNGGGKVTATEWEAEKAARARANFEKAGLQEYIDLREGDLAETLKAIDGPIDFVLLDVWTEAVMPAMRNIAKHLRKRAVIIADNTSSSRPGYAAYFAYLTDPANGFHTMTLPFEGGLEMSVKL